MEQVKEYSQDVQGSEIFAHARIAYNAIKQAETRTQFAVFLNGNLVVGGNHKDVNISPLDAKNKYGNLLQYNGVELLIFNDVCARRLYAKKVHLSPVFIKELKHTICALCAEMESELNKVINETFEA